MQAQTWTRTLLHFLVIFHGLLKANFNFRLFLGNASFVPREKTELKATQNTAFKVTDVVKTSPTPRGFTRTLADGKENACETPELSCTSCAVPRGSALPSCSALTDTWVRNAAFVHKYQLKGRNWQLVVSRVFSSSHAFAGCFRTVLLVQHLQHLKHLNIWASKLKLTLKPKQF